MGSTEKCKNIADKTNEIGQKIEKRGKGREGNELWNEA